MIKSAQQSSIQNDIKYRSMSAGNVPSNEYLIQTTVVGATPAASIEFDVSDYAGIYRHLKIIGMARTNRADVGDLVLVRFNSDTATNYSDHFLRGNGSSPTSGARASSNSARFRRIAGGNDTANVFGAFVIDLLDPFETTKYPTIRVLGGSPAATYSEIALSSGSWRNTAAITTIDLIGENGSFVSGSRFSLYGVTA